MNIVCYKWKQCVFKTRDLEQRQTPQSRVGLVKANGGITAFALVPGCFLLHPLCWRPLL